MATLIFNSIITLQLVSIALLGQTTTMLSSQEINKLMPDWIMGGYTVLKHPLAREMKVGTLTYSLAERSFSSEMKKIKILLFDYIEAPIMYSQATKKFSAYTPVESDSLVLRPFESVNY